MNSLRGEQAITDNSLSRFIQNDYFYKAQSGKPKVSFAPVDKDDKDTGADPVDSYMDKRPPKSGENSVLKNLANRRKSFITNVNLVPQAEAGTTEVQR